MSVQDYPRIYFNGHMNANPATANNNDNFYPDGTSNSAVTYLGGKVDLNWDLIQLPKPTVEPAPSVTVNQQQRKDIRSWFITPRQDTDQPPGKSQPCEWNYYGGNQANFVQFAGDSSEGKPAQLTAPVGGALSPTEAADSSDPFLQNSQVFLVGDSHSKKAAFAGPPDWPTTSSPGSPGRLVDVDPLSTWSTQIYYKYIFIGQPGCGIIMARTTLFQLRYFLGWANWQTAVESGPELWIENPAVGDTGHSPLLQAFQDALNDPANKGLNLFLQHRVFGPNDPAGINNPPQGGGPFNNGQFPYAVYDTQAGLQTQYDRQFNLEFPTLQQDKIGFYSPSYPSSVGTIGVWRKDEALRFGAHRSLFD